MIITDNLELTSESFELSEKKQTINDALFYLSIGLALCVMLYCYTLDIEDVMSILITLFFLFTFLMLRRNWAFNQRLKLFEKIKKPIFIIQEGIDDVKIVKTRNEVAKLLQMSGNDLWKQKKIEIKTIFYQDPQHDICESYEEYMGRRMDIVKDTLRTWSSTIKHREWVEENLLNQDVHVKVTLEEKMLELIHSFASNFSNSN
jgi:hypothetical protein